jgi:hypothetical protein
VKKRFFIAAFVLGMAINGVISSFLYTQHASLRPLLDEVSANRTWSPEIILCRRMDRDDLSDILKADLVLVSKSREIDGSIYQIITEIIPLKKGAWSFHEVGQPIGPGIETRFLSEIPSGAIHYSWDPSPHNTFTDLFAPTPAQREAGAPSLEDVIARIRAEVGSR